MRYAIWMYHFGCVDDSSRVESFCRKATARFLAAAVILFVLVSGSTTWAQAQDDGDRHQRTNGGGGGHHRKHKPKSAPAPGVAGDPYWDLNGTTAGAGSATPTGVWSTTVANWNPLANGTGTTAVWNNGDAAVFSAGTDATGSFTVSFTNNQSVSASSITIEEGSPTINMTSGSGSTLSIGAGGITINSGATLTMSGSKLTVALTAAQSWTNSSIYLR
jgi:hypothetical protein